MNRLLPNSPKSRPCGACGLPIAPQFSLCAACVNKLTPSLKSQLWSHWRDRQRDHFGLSGYTSILTECLAYLKQLNNPSQRRVEADRERLAGVCDEILEGEK